MNLPQLGRVEIAKEKITKRCIIGDMIPVGMPAQERPRDSGCVEPVDIPHFRDDGYLPEGVHRCTETELTVRFGTHTRRRRQLILRLRRWTELGRMVGALRLLVDGSFVTDKIDPDDIDAVMLVPADFVQQVQRGVEAALELEEMFSTRQPAELFPAEDQAIWREWCEFFSRTREPDRRRKGLLEIVL